MKDFINHSKIDIVEKRELKLALEQIEIISTKLNYKIPKDYADFYSKLQSNRLDNKFFIVDNKEKIIQSLLSMDCNNKINILKFQICDSQYKDLLVTFAILEFGDSLCFNRNTNEIIYYDQELDSIIALSRNWTDFEKNLYN